MEEAKEQTMAHAEQDRNIDANKVYEAGNITRTETTEFAELMKVNVTEVTGQVTGQIDAATTAEKEEASNTGKGPTMKPSETW